MTRLLRIGLGLIIMVVFASRVEAATVHCVRLMHENAPVVAAAPACHMTAMAEDAEKPQPKRQHPPASCECMTFTQSIDPAPPTLAESRIAAFTWRRPGSDLLVSRDLPPARPPPKS